MVRLTVVTLIAGLFAAGCSDPTGPEQLESLTLTPATSTVGPAATVQLTATGTRAGTDVTNLIGETFAVTSGGGSVDANGLFTAPTTPGTSTITVTCGGMTATATVVVGAGALATITVTPNATLAIGATQQFTAVGRDAFNNIVAMTPVWSTTNPPWHDQRQYGSVHGRQYTRHLQRQRYGDVRSHFRYGKRHSYSRPARDDHGHAGS
jgi:hypothetical protein